MLRSTRPCAPPKAWFVRTTIPGDSEVVGEPAPEPALELCRGARGGHAPLGACDVAPEQLLLEVPGQLSAAREQHQLGVAIERPGVEVHRAEADRVVGDDDLCVHDG